MIKSVASTIKRIYGLRVGDEEPDKPFQELFVGKKKDNRFTANARILQEYFSDSLNTQLSILRYNC